MVCDINLARVHDPKHALRVSEFTPFVSTDGSLTPSSKTCDSLKNAHAALFHTFTCSQIIHLAIWIDGLIGLKRHVNISVDHITFKHITGMTFELNIVK